jgi:hypothetical protein
MGAISTHKSLRTLSFARIKDEHGNSLDLSTRRDRTKALATVLLINKNVDRIPFDPLGTFDHHDWDTLVAPKVECNLYRKRFVALEKIEEPSTRAAVVTRALVHVSGKPSLVYMLLSRNHDVLSSYLDETFTCDTTRSRFSRAVDRLREYFELH